MYNERSRHRENCFTQEQIQKQVSEMAQALSVIMQVRININRYFERILLFYVRFNAI